MPQAENRYRITFQCICAVVLACSAVAGKTVHAGCGDYLMPLGVVHGVDMKGEDPHSVSAGFQEEFEHPLRRKPRCQGPGCGQSPANGSSGLMAPVNSRTADQQFECACELSCLLQDPPAVKLGNGPDSNGYPQTSPSGLFRPPRVI